MRNVGLVLLGDWNRNPVHEAGRPENERVRSEGNPTDPYRPGVRSGKLWREINDGEPARSTLMLLPSECPGTVAALCQAAKSGLLGPPELNQLTAPTGLGCRNPLGLDHVAGQRRGHGQRRESAARQNGAHARGRCRTSRSAAGPVGPLPPARPDQVLTGARPARPADHPPCNRGHG